MIKTRFAPSPTGFLHVGGLRTALFAYLFAKKNNGKLILRIEDTDRERFVEGGMENILNSLDWAGIEIDEGVKFDDSKNITQVGDNGPYIQSERLEIYHKYIEELLESGHAYYCFCTKERLDELRTIQEANKQPTGYDGCCREVTLEEAKKRIDAGEKYVIRLKMPREGVAKFTDIIRGEVEFENKLIDDQVLIKSDGFPTYHFAVVVDDHLMEITHIIRGEEWISSTPKGIQLYKAFGWDIPEYAHLPLLVNEKKQKLSKRHGDVSVEDFKEKGYLPEALINFVSFLGWNPGDEREIFSIKDLEKEFDLSKGSKSAAVFDRVKLDWYNSEYMKKMSNTELAELAMPFFINAGYQDKLNSDDFKLEDIVALEKERVNNLSEIPEAVNFLFADKLEYDEELIVWKKSTKEDAFEKLNLLRELLNTIDVEDWNAKKLEEIIIAWIKENEFGVGDVLWPMRVALSGQKNSPGPFEIAGVLGKDKTIERISLS
jgi:nondiscriminating glutamyl-tRNA synthetase